MIQCLVALIRGVSQEVDCTQAVDFAIVQRAKLLEWAEIGCYQDLWRMLVLLVWWAFDEKMGWFSVVG